jgi:hypothetical protein
MASLARAVWHPRWTCGLGAWLGRTRPWAADAGALLAVGVGLAGVHGDLIDAGIAVGMDTATAFYPWYTFLGERLRAGVLPVWNPYQFSGMPFAADPESGWTYLPAMALFSALPLPAAATGYLVTHIVIAALGSYALARMLGLGAAGSGLAALAYSGSGYLYGHNACCFAYAGVSAWLPLMLLGAEGSLRAVGTRARVLWWGLAGLGLSQILAVWVGQGAYYAVLTLAAFVTARRLTPVPRSIADLRSRCVDVLLDSVGIGACGTGLAAAGLVPRLEFDLLSNLPLGYPDSGSSPPLTHPDGWGLIDNWDGLLLEPGFYYLGVTVALAALTTAVLGVRQRVVPVLTLFSLLALVLARSQPTPLHAWLAVLPGFEHLTGRSPERALIMFYIWPALLAGRSLTAVCQAPRWAGTLVPLLLTGGLLLVRSEQHASAAPGAPLVAAGGLLAVSAVVPRRTWRPALSALLVLAVWADLRVATQAEFAEAQQGSAAYELRKVNLADYASPTGGARFLQARAGDGEPFRYLGYVGHVFGGPYPYTLHWSDPSIVALEENNRGLLTRLGDVQGYDPIHLARYDQFMAAVNGTQQNYHHADAFDAGLDSPLLRLLNARYLLVPTVAAQDQVLATAASWSRVAYRDASVTVLENPTTLPRAWIVHQARQVSPARALDLLATGAVDPLREVLVEQSPPAVATPANPSGDFASVVGYEPEQMHLRASTDAAGLLVLSEVAYPAWRAYIDGQPAPLYTADVILRAVPLAPGGHDIDIRYESSALTAGLAITAACAAGLVGLVIAAVSRRLGQATGLLGRLSRS